MKLADALLDVVGHLESSGVACAVVGGIAASARGEVRFTRDIDVAVAVQSDEVAEKCIFGLRQAGYVVLATVEQEAVGRLATARLRHTNGVVCDLIFATCGIELEVVASAEVLELFPGCFAPTASVETLLAMKVLSATPKRPRDLGDIQAIARAAPKFKERELLELLVRIEHRGYARGQQLSQKWRELRASLGI